MEISFKYKKLGQILIQKLRDENYELYLERKEHTRSISHEEYKRSQISQHASPELQKLYDERFEFLKSLSEEQLRVLDKLVLHLLDSTAFNFLREIEENLDEDKSIGLTIDGENIEKTAEEFLSGTMFGEYFLWIEKNSKYGDFQL
ncbi:MAG: hypothetical protein AB8F95_17085 [Bacteroidia bacterium]